MKAICYKARPIRHDQKWKPPSAVEGSRHDQRKAQFVSEIENPRGSSRQARPDQRGEDEAQYRRLLAAVTDDMQPQTFLDQIKARELADKLWDQRRNRTSVAALVETSFIRAVADLLRNSMLREVPTEPPRELSDPWKPEPLHISVVQAHEYYDSKTTAARRREIDASLARYGITQDQIRAKAMECCVSSIQTFARLEENNDRFIRRTLKDHAGPQTGQAPVWRAVGEEVD